MPTIKTVTLRTTAVALSLAGIAFSTGSTAQDRGSHVYIQTNEIDNKIIDFHRAADGQLHEAGRIATSGKGSGEFKPVTGEESAPNAFEGAGSVILSADRKYLFAANGGDNTVSVFSISPTGLKLLDTEATGQAVTGRSGTAKSLAYDNAKGVLYVVHTFGPDHVRLLDFRSGQLTARPLSYTVNTRVKTDRLPTQAVLSPDGKFLLVDILFDRRPGKKADGSPDLAIANDKDKDGLVVFPVNANGSLGKAVFNDAGGKAPFFVKFLPGSSTRFINAYAASDGLAVSTINKAGKVRSGPVVPIDASRGMPSELCWISLSGDGKYVFTSNFGLGSVSVYSLNGTTLRLIKDHAVNEPGNGKFASINMVPTSAPSDSWSSSDGRNFYQLYPNASKLVSYRIEGGGGLTKIGESSIPYQSPQGAAGF
jgi:DNA-binding beta-propeller fold protein YncE